MVNLNVELDELLMKKIKAKAAILGLDIKEYVFRVFDKDTKDLNKLEGLK